MKKNYASSYYAATLLYKDEEELDEVEEPFLSDLLGDVLSDVVIDRGLTYDPSEITIVIEDAITISNDEGNHARVFLVQALHPAGE